MTVAQSAKETEAEGLRCAQPEGEASNMRASEDILERAKTSLKRHDPINQGFYTSMPPEDVQIWKELIAEVEAKNDKIVQDAITIQMHHNNVLALQKDVERWKSAYYRERELCPFPDSDCSRIRDRDARITELKEMIKQLGRLAFMHDVPLDQIVDHFVSWGQSTYAYTNRLETSFLEAETERKFYTTVNGMSSDFDWKAYPETPQNGIHKEWFRQKAREALARIKEGQEG